MVRDDLVILWGRWRWIGRRRWWLIGRRRWWWIEVTLRDLEVVEE